MLKDELFSWYQNDKSNGDCSQPNSDYSKLSSENSQECAVRNLDYCMQPPPWRVVNTKDINESANKKRDIKDKLKRCQSIIGNFFIKYKSSW